MPGLRTAEKYIVPVFGDRADLLKRPDPIARSLWQLILLQSVRIESIQDDLEERLRWMTRDAESATADFERGYVPGIEDGVTPAKEYATRLGEAREALSSIVRTAHRILTDTTPATAKKTADH